VAGDAEAGELFVELSHPRRLTILRLLRDSPRRLGEIAGQVDTPAPEVSRHLDRLAHQGLVERGGDRAFRLTPYGRAVTDALPAFDFMVKHRDFLRTHDLSVLPTSFASRLAELSQPERGSTFSDTLRHVERVLTEAKEFAWFLSGEAMLSGDAVRAPAVRSGISIRVLVPTTLFDPPVRYATPGTRESRFEVRVLPEVRIAIAMNERLAGMSFPDLSGRIDYSAGLRGTSPAFRGWCRELFEHFWAQGRPVRV
jgi:predicted transcriptional regulator